MFTDTHPYFFIKKVCDKFLWCRCSRLHFQDKKYWHDKGYISRVKTWMFCSLCVKKRVNMEYYFITCVFPKIKLKSFEESTTTALIPNLFGISTFLGFQKSGGNLNSVTAL